MDFNNLFYLELNTEKIVNKIFFIFCNCKIYDNLLYFLWLFIHLLVLKHIAFVFHKLNEFGYSLIFSQLFIKYSQTQKSRILRVLNSKKNSVTITILRIYALCKWAIREKITVIIIEILNYDSIILAEEHESNNF